MGTYQLQELIGGHSGAENYKISQHNQDFMLKIFPPDFSPVKLAAIPAICELYSQLGINSLHCVKIGKIDATNQYFCIYNYIDGKNLEIIGEEEYTPVDNYHLGEHVGKWLKTLKAATLPSEVELEIADIMDLTDYINKLYKSMIANPETRDLLLAYFDIHQLEYLLQGFNHASLFFDQDRHLIHGDIKRSNLMRDQNGIIYIIDIESMKYGHDMFNFRHQMTLQLRTDNIRRTQFLKGVFDGLYSYSRPEHFNEQVLYIYAFNFIEHLHSCYGKRDFAETKTYLELIQKNLPVVLNPKGNVI